MRWFHHEQTGQGMIDYVGAAVVVAIVVAALTTSGLAELVVDTIARAIREGLAPLQQ